MLIPKCPTCNNSMRTENEQVGFDNTGKPIIHVFGYCDNCRLKVDMQQNPHLYHEEKTNQNDSCTFGAFAVCAAIFGLVISCFKGIGIFVDLVGIILAIVGLCKSEPKKHYHIISICLCVFGLLLALVSYSADNLVDEPNKIENEYVENNTQINNDIDLIEEFETETESETEIITESEEEYKASCQEYKYKDVVRDPENYIGKRVKIEIEVSSVHEASWLNNTKYYFGNSKDETYDQYWGDSYGVYDLRNPNDESWFKILSDDVIMVYGEIADTEHTTSLILNSEELFCIEMKYAELISE